MIDIHLFFFFLIPEEGHVELTPLEDAYYKLKELNAGLFSLFSLLSSLFSLLSSLFSLLSFSPPSSLIFSFFFFFSFFFSCFLDVNKWKSLEENRKIVQGWQKKIKDLPKDVILSAPGYFFFFFFFFSLIFMILRFTQFI